jgi:hypothetical protein
MQIVTKSRIQAVAARLDGLASISTLWQQFGIDFDDFASVWKPLL